MEAQRHEIIAADQPSVTFTTELAQLPRKVLRLLGVSKSYDG